MTKENESDIYIREEAKWAKKTLECRQIISVINQYGIDEFKRAKLIELLAFELENREESIAIIDEARKLLDKSFNNKRRIET